MPPPADDMTDLDRPATRRELREELELTRRELREELELTRRGLREELQAFATKDELRKELQTFATKDELQVLATKEDLRKLRDELRTHFDVVAESFKSQFGTLHDWVEANTNSLATRVEQLENGHGARLLSLEGRVTHLENRPK
jgi:hypothetical protein